MAKILIFSLPKGSTFPGVYEHLVSYILLSNVPSLLIEQCKKSTGFTVTYLLAQGLGSQEISHVHCCIWLKCLAYWAMWQVALRQQMNLCGCVVTLTISALLDNIYICSLMKSVRISLRKWLASSWCIWFPSSILIVYRLNNSCQLADDSIKGDNSAWKGRQIGANTKGWCCTLH